MADRKPLVRVGGKSKQLPAGDKLPFAALPVGNSENTVAAGDDPRIVYANTPNWQGVGADVSHFANGLFTVSDPLNGPTVDYAGDTEKIWFVRDTYEVARVQTAHWASAPADVAAESKIYVRTRAHYLGDWTPWTKLLLDAPEDSKTYARKDGEWVEVGGGGGSDVMAAKTIKGNKNAVSAAPQDLSPSEARTVMELGTAAVADTGTGPSNVILGNDSRLSDARTPTAHSHAISDVTGFVAELAGKENTLVAGANITIDRTNPAAPVVSAAGGGVGANWGQIGGLLADQLDLQSSLNAKADDNDTRLTDAREWTATTVTQADAEAGTATTRRAWTAQRVRQAIAAWWDSVDAPQDSKQYARKDGAWAEVVAQSIPFLLYDDRATLRSTPAIDGKQAIVEGLGLFVHHVGSDEPDDDESCFATATGRWLLEAVHWDVVEAWQLDESFGWQFNSAFDTRVLHGTATCAITSVSTASSASFTGTVTGAAVGDRVIATPPTQLGDTAVNTGRLSYHAFVSAANTVTVMLTNASAANATTHTDIRAAWPITVIKEI